MVLFGLSKLGIISILLAEPSMLLGIVLPGAMLIA
jgi:hypothetical protein